MHFNYQDRELVSVPIICQNPYLQAKLEELANVYPNSLFSILTCKVINIVVNDIYIGPFINSLVGLGWLYENFGLSLERYGIDCLIKFAKYFMISSDSKPKPFRVLIEYWQGFTFWERTYMLSCLVKSSRVSKSIISVFFNLYVYVVRDKNSRSSQKNNQSCSSSFRKNALLLYTMLSPSFFPEIVQYLLTTFLFYQVLCIFCK